MHKYLKLSINYYHELKTDSGCLKKLKKIRSNIGDLNINESSERDYIKLWKRFGKKPPVLFHRCMCTISDIVSSLYVPENIHYEYIEPVLNNHTLALNFNDKNFFERYLIGHKHHFPMAVLRGINGVFYCPEYKQLPKELVLNILKDLLDDGEFILKPAIVTGGGENVVLVQKKDGRFLILNNTYSNSAFYSFLKEKYDGSFVLQNRINQHPWFEAFNSTSLNTVRLYTYRSVVDESVIPLAAYIRFGKPGSLVDSSSQGGRTCGVSMSGRLNDFALGKYGEKYHDLDGIIQNKGTMVPSFGDMIRIAREIAPFFNYHRLLGFDFSVDYNNNIKLMEVNNLYVGIINQQMNTGPLFGEYTEEVVEYCLSHNKSVFFHFSI